MITENDVKCFLDLTRTLNFTATADNLYITQQAVSKRIDGLEKEVGVKLFHRSYHEVALTEDGEIFAELFERFAREYDRTVDQRRKNESFRKNILTVGYQSWVHYNDIPYRTHMAMNERFPGFELRGRMHTAHELMSLLETGTVGVVMLYERLAGPLLGFRSIVLKEIDVVLLVSKAKVSDAEDSRLEAYASEPFLIDADEIASFQGDFSLTGLKAYGISPTELLIRPNRDSVYLSVELGQGVTIGTSLSHTEHLSITKIPTGKKDNLICVWREDAQDPRIKVYADLLREFFQQ